MNTSLKKYFIKGLKAFLPITLTMAIIIWLFQSLEVFFGYLVKCLLPNYYVPGMGIMLGFMFIFMLGILVSLWLTKSLYEWFEKLVKKVPLINSIYSAVQDLFHFFERTQDASANQAVLLEFGDLKVIGFVTRESLTELPEELGSEEHVLVYVPMSYMIGGFMMSVPKSKLKPLNMPVNSAMSLVITAGMLGEKKSIDS